MVFSIVVQANTGKKLQGKNLGKNLGKNPETLKYGTEHSPSD